MTANTAATVSSLALCVTFMGLEAYLFQIRFSIPPIEAGAIVLLEEAGMSYLKERSNYQAGQNYGSHYFEQRTANGLIEASLITAPGDPTVDEFSLRFSVLSPMSVVDQIFDFLNRLHTLSPIEVYDTEIRNDIMRQLRQSGKVDKDFEGLEDEDEEAIDKLCFISLNADDFKRNELKIMKRERVLNNIEGIVIEGSSATIDYIEKKGLFDRFFGWMRKEL
jgi:hypothetical protein